MNLKVAQIDNNLVHRLLWIAARELWAETHPGIVFHFLYDNKFGVKCELYPKLDAYFGLKRCHVRAQFYVAVG